MSSVFYICEVDYMWSFGKYIRKENKFPDESTLEQIWQFAKFSKFNFIGMQFAFGLRISKMKKLLKGSLNCSNLKKKNLPPCF